MHTSPKISERFKSYRKTMGLTQAKLAEQLGTVQTAISAYESGDRLPSTETLLTIAEVHCISPNWLLGLSERMFIKDDITLYTDLLRLLVAICSVKDIDSNNLFSIDFPDSDSELDETVIKVKDYTIRDFLSEWVKIYRLYSDGTIDREIYNLWLDKHYAEMNIVIDRIGLE